MKNKTKAWKHVALFVLTGIVGFLSGLAGVYFLANQFMVPT